MSEQAPRFNETMFNADQIDHMQAQARERERQAELEMATAINSTNLPLARRLLEMQRQTERLEQTVERLEAMIIGLQDRAHEHPLSHEEIAAVWR